MDAIFIIYERNSDMFLKKCPLIVSTKSVHRKCPPNGANIHTQTDGHHETNTESADSVKIY